MGEGSVGGHPDAHSAGGVACRGALPATCSEVGCGQGKRVCQHGDWHGDKRGRSASGFPSRPELRRGEMPEAERLSATGEGHYTPGEAGGGRCAAVAIAQQQCGDKPDRAESGTFQYIRLYTRGSREGLCRQTAGGQHPTPCGIGGTGQQCGETEQHNTD